MQLKPAMALGARTGMVSLLIALGSGLYAQMVVGVQAGWTQIHSSGAEYHDPYWKMSYTAGDVEGDGYFASAFVRSSDSTRFAFQMEVGYAQRRCLGAYEEVWNDYGSHSHFLGTSEYRLGSVDLGFLASFRAARWVRLVGGLQFQMLESARHIKRGERWVSNFGDETTDPDYEQTVSGTKGYDNGIAYVAGFALSPIHHLWFEARYVGMLTPVIVLENADAPVRSWSLQAGLAYELFSK